LKALNLATNDEASKLIIVEIFSIRILCKANLPSMIMISEPEKLRGFSPQANYTDRVSDRRLSEKLVPALADRGCRVVSATIPPQSLTLVF
jgi:hypothetical protein